MIFTRLSLFGTVPLLLPIVVAIDVEEPDNTIEFDGVSKSCVYVSCQSDDKKTYVKHKYKRLLCFGSSGSSIGGICVLV